MDDKNRESSVPSRIMTRSNRKETDPLVNSAQIKLLPQASSETKRPTGPLGVSPPPTLIVPGKKPENITLLESKKQNSQKLSKKKVKNNTITGNVQTKPNHSVHLSNKNHITLKEKFKSRNQSHSKSETHHTNNDNFLTFHKNEPTAVNDSTAINANAPPNRIIENMLPLGMTVRKGRQKVRPRKKKLTSLKKKVLMERLEQYHDSIKEDNGNDQSSENEHTVSEQGISSQQSLSISSLINENLMNDFTKNDDDRFANDTIVCLRGYIDSDEISDDDEYDEIIGDLANLAEKITQHNPNMENPIIENGDTSSSSEIQVYIPRDDEKHAGLAFVKFDNKNNALAAKECWDKLVIGGNSLSADLIKTKKLKSGNLREVVSSILETDLLFNEGSEREFKIVNKILNAHCNDSLDCNNNENLWTVQLDNILTEEDFEDAECLQEAEEDVKTLGMKYGKIYDVKIKEEKGNADDQTNSTQPLRGHIILSYANKNEATEAVQGFNGMKIGGALVSATLIDQNQENVSNNEGSTLVLENVLTEDDYEDEECREETISDISNLVSKFGVVSSIKLELEGSYQRGLIFVRYDTSSYGDNSASVAANDLNGMMIGGQIITAKEILQGNASQLPFAPKDQNRKQTLSMLENIVTDDGYKDKEIKQTFLILENILTEDDYEDEECREETEADVFTLAEKFGPILKINMILDGANKGDVTIHYNSVDGFDAAVTAASSINGTMFGGQIVSARYSEVPDLTDGNSVSCLNTAKNEKATSPSIKDEPEPLFSGGKIIPEQYAKCKRVPKVPTPAAPREYASKLGEEAVSLLIEMLGELMRLQQRSKDDKNARSRRRLVMGLREVARGIRANKVKMVVMANNLDKYGVIDSRLQEILDLAREEDVPVFFDLNKRKLGKALGKSIKVSVVGIQNADGAHEPFKKLKKIAISL